MKYLAYITTIIAFFVIHACCLDEDISLTQNILYSSSCLEELEITLMERDSCEFDSFSDLCLYEIEPVTYLSQIGKEWLPFYCLEENEKLYYSNGKSELVVQNVFSSIYHFGHDYHRFSDDNCEEGKYRMVCKTTEVAITKVRIENYPLEIILHLASGKFHPLYPESSTYISIDSYDWDNVVSDSDILINHFDLTVDSYNSGQPKMQPKHLFHNSIVLNGIEFNDVYTFKDDEIEKGQLKIYYNKVFGIVAFVDLKGELWVLNK